MKCFYPQGGRKDVTGQQGKLLREYPCGQCMACRINKRQQWVFRLLLEMRQRKYSYFVTLTYKDDYLVSPYCKITEDLRPVYKRSGGLFLLGELDRNAHVKFIRKLRKLEYRRMGKENVTKIRYFVVGEYGEREGRPHYHFIIFSDHFIDVTYNNKGKISDSQFHKAWNDNGDSIGLVDVVIIPGMADGLAVARYCAGYVLKKLTTEKAVKDAHGDGRQPEFSQCSRRPGIGCDSDSIFSITQAMKNKGVLPSYVDYQGVIKKTKDIHLLRFNGKKYPVDRTLKAKLIDKLGGDYRTVFGKQLQHHQKVIENWMTKDTEEDAKARKESFYKSKKVYKQNHSTRKF